MRSMLSVAVLVGLVVGVFAFASREASQAQDKTSDNLAHMVYFKLKDNSPAAAAKLVESCKKHLTGHDGTVYFSAGVLAKDLKREVNDTDWDVALHLVFKDLPSHDKYQVHSRHEEFIKEGKDNWSKVRVFDSYVSGK